MVLKILYDKFWLTLDKKLQTSLSLLFYSILYQLLKNIITTEFSVMFRQSQVFVVYKRPFTFSHENTKFRKIKFK